MGHDKCYKLGHQGNWCSLEWLSNWRMFYFLSEWKIITWGLIQNFGIYAIHTAILIAIVTIRAKQLLASFAKSIASHIIIVGSITRRTSSRRATSIAIQRASLTSHNILLTTRTRSIDSSELKLCTIVRWRFACTSATVPKNIIKRRSSILFEGGHWSSAIALKTLPDSIELICWILVDHCLETITSRTAWSIATVTCCCWSNVVYCFWNWTTATTLYCDD